MIVSKINLYRFSNIIELHFLIQIIQLLLLTPSKVLSPSIQIPRGESTSKVVMIGPFSTDFNSGHKKSRGVRSGEWGGRERTLI